MKNYFISLGGWITPFDKVINVKKDDEMTTITNTNNDLYDCSLDQYDDYIAWLDLQLQKDIAIARPDKVQIYESEFEKQIKETQSRILERELKLNKLLEGK